MARSFQCIRRYLVAIIRTGIVGYSWSLAVYWSSCKSRKIVTSCNCFTWGCQTLETLNSLKAVVILKTFSVMNFLVCWTHKRPTLAIPLDQGNRKITREMLEKDFLWQISWPQKSLSAAKGLKADKHLAICRRRSLPRSVRASFKAI